MLLVLVHPFGEGDDDKGKRIQDSMHCRRLTRRSARLPLPMISLRSSFLHTTGAPNC
jgi:hypothetical protein